MLPTSEGVWQQVLCTELCCLPYVCHVQAQAHVFLYLGILVAGLLVAPWFHVSVVSAVLSMSAPLPAEQLFVTSNPGTSPVDIFLMISQVKTLQDSTIVGVLQLVRSRRYHLWMPAGFWAI